ncbi:MAG: hypothetical protein AAFV49_18545 [Pseudomonadota bacterium]
MVRFNVDGAELSDAEVTAATNFISEAFACDGFKIAVISFASTGGEGLVEAIARLERSNAFIDRLTGEGVDATRLEARASTNVGDPDLPQGILLQVFNGGT